MSQRLDVLPVLLTVSVIRSRGSDESPVRSALESDFGSIGLESEQFPFDLSDYYREEMGTDLVRTWFCFTELCGAEFLPDWKHRCSEIEERLSGSGSRVYNLDPGYLDHGKLVLASFKGAPDKLYMGRGVWAHTCLRYRFGRFRAPDHSFPDFADGRFSKFMKRAKGYYRKLLKRSSVPTS